MKRKVFAIAFLVTILALCVETTSVHAQAGQITIKPTDDTYTSFQNPNTNYGGQYYLEVVSSSSSQSTVFLKFNLSSIPVGAVIDNVTLQLYTTLVSEPYRIGIASYSSNSWNESTLTRNGYYSLNATIDLETIPIIWVNSSNQWYSWNALATFNSAILHVGSAETTFLLMTFTSYSPYSFVWFASKEYPADYSPRLTVHWSGIVPEFPPVALVPSFMIVTSLIAVFYRRKNKKFTFAQAKIPSTHG